MKGRASRLVFSLILVIALIGAVFCTVSSAEGAGEYEYTVTVYADTANNSNIEYFFDFSDGGDVTLTNPKSDSETGFEKFTLNTDSRVLYSLRIRSDLSDKSGWYINKVVIRSEYDTPKGQHINETVTCPVGAAIEIGSPSVTVYPARNGGLFYYDEDKTFHFEHTDKTSEISSEGLYRVINYIEAYTQDDSEDIYVETELMYDFTPKSQTVFNIGSESMYNYYALGSKLKNRNGFMLKSVNGTFANGFITFLNIGNPSVGIDDAVFTENLTTVGYFTDTRIPDDASFVRVGVETLMLGDMSEIPDWIPTAYPNVKSVYLTQNMKDCSSEMLKFASDTVFYFSADGVETLRERYADDPDLCSRIQFAPTDVSFYTASVFSVGDEGISVGWIIAAVELVIIFALCIVLIKLKMKCDDNAENRK